MHKYGEGDLCSEGLRRFLPRILELEKRLGKGHGTEVEAGYVGHGGGRTEQFQWLTG